MKKVIIGGLAALAISLTGAAPAQADDDIAAMDYSMGYDMGLVNLQLYPQVPVVSQQSLCRGSYVRDAYELRQIDSSLSISKSDYLAGCYDAVGA